MRALMGSAEGIRRRPGYRLCPRCTSRGRAPARSTPMAPPIRLVERRTPDPTVDPVCAFYTSHPYPAPVDNLDRARAEWQDPGRDRAEYHLYWPDSPYRGDLDILVAGCGTWQAAKYALCRPAA